MVRGTVPSDLEISQRDFIFSRLTPVTRPLGGESAVTSHDLPTLPPSESPGIFVRGRARVSCLFVLTGALSPRGIPTVQLPSPILRTRIGGGSRGYTNIWRISPRFHCLPAGRPPHLCASTFGAGGRAIAAAACACGAGIGRRTRGGEPPGLGGGGGYSRRLTTPGSSAPAVGSASSPSSPSVEACQRAASRPWLVLPTSRWGRPSPTWPLTCNKGSSDYRSPATPPASAPRSALPAPPKSRALFGRTAWRPRGGVRRGALAPPARRSVRVGWGRGGTHSFLSYWGAERGLCTAFSS